MVKTTDAIKLTHREKYVFVLSIILLIVASICVFIGFKNFGYYNAYWSHGYEVPNFSPEYFWFVETPCMIGGGLLFFLGYITLNYFFPNEKVTDVAS